VVDGTRDRPPGRTAQITGRKDGIRAGAVSGPWRSGSVPAGAPAPKPEPLRAPAQPAPARAQAAAPPDPARHRVPPPEPATPAATRSASAAPLSGRPSDRPSDRNLRAIAWVGFGLLVAAGAVVAAVLLRPPGVAPPAPATALEPAPAPPVEAAVPAAAPAAGALAEVSVVRLRVGPDFPADRQAAILAALDGAGIKNVKVESLPFEVATSRVGYYRPEDVAAADALAKIVTPVIGAGDGTGDGSEGGAIGVRDYGKLLDNAEPGRLDLWVGD